MENWDADQHSGSPRIDAVYDSELKSVDTAEAVVVELAQQMGFDEDELHRIGIAMREAMVNAVVHGNKYSGVKKVRMKVWSGGESLKVVVTDEGSGFEISRVPDPLAKENLLKESGRGILLMQAFVDEFQVRRLQPVGTEVTMVKYLASR
ncbi:MAG: ATP-binding protein [Bryobacterales bacterium]|nr:ATP-binding protein [Bryobacterales bacterium]